MDAEREQFEAWAAEEGWRNFTRVNEGYAVDHLDDVWQAWQAARRTVSGQEAAWIRMDHLRQAQQAPFLCRVEPSFRPGFDLVPIYLAAPIPATEQEKS